MPAFSFSSFKMTHFLCTPWQYCRIFGLDLPIIIHPRKLRACPKPRRVSARLGEAPLVHISGILCVHVNNRYNKYFVLPVISLMYGDQPRDRDSEKSSCERASQTTMLPMLTACFTQTEIGTSMYLYLRRDVWKKNDQRNENRTRRWETTRARPRPPRAESGETSNFRHDEQRPHTPNGGPHLELGRLRLKARSKSDFSTSIAETTWPTYL